MELTALRTLCQGTMEGPLLREGLKILADYQFILPAHEVLFQALKDLPTDATDLIREQLPARLNNRGFPDLELEDFFLPHAFSRKDALELLHGLAVGTDLDSANHASG